MFKHNLMNGNGSTNGRARSGQMMWIFLGVVAAIGLWFAVEGGRTYSQGIAYETTLNAQYNANQIVLSEFYMKLLNGMNITNAKKNGVLEALDKTVQTFGDPKKGDFSKSPLMLALGKAFPDTDWASSYDKLIDMVSVGQEKFAQYQIQMQSVIKPYEQFLHPVPLNLPRFAIVKWCFPSDALRAQVGREEKTGMAALKLMRKPVTSAEGDDAFDTGQQKPVTFPGNTPASPSK